MEYKFLTEDDIDEVSAMYAETFNSEPWCEKWTKKTASKRLLQMLKNEASFGIAATENGIVGMILGEEKQYFDGTAFMVNEFFVKNSERGKGIGTALLNKLEGELKKRGIRAVELCTIPEEEGFYKKNGYYKSETVIMGKEL